MAYALRYMLYLYFKNLYERQPTGNTPHSEALRELRRLDKVIDKKEQILPRRIY